MISIDNPSPNNFAPKTLHLDFFGFPPPLGSPNPDTTGFLVDTVFTYNVSTHLYEFNHPLMGWVRFDNPSEFSKYVDDIHKIYWS